MKAVLDYLKSITENGYMPSYIPEILYMLLLLAVALISAVLACKIMLPVVTRFVKKSKFRWDDVFLENNVFRLLSYLVPAIIVYLAASLLAGYQVLIRKFAVAYIMIISAMVIGALLDSINDIYTSFPIAKTRPIKGLIQVVKIAVYIIMGIAVVANFMGKDPFILLGSIGALTALLSLIFKDPILGFVAGIQLTGNNMLMIGDWIEVPKYGADGIVTELTMTTVKVQNFDKTIVNIPAYALISDSFKNWRGMSEAGGRRIKRSVNIDINTVRFCTPEMIEKYKRIGLLREYIEKKEADIARYNTEHNVDTSLIINGRRLTNLGTFRAYIENYLNTNPNIHRSLTRMVRQLMPTEHGVALEIYAFTTTTKWIEYEAIQADIFDHIIAAAPEFDLRIYQQPSGNDLRSLSTPGRM